MVYCIERARSERDQTHREMAYYSYRNICVSFSDPTMKALPNHLCTTTFALLNPTKKRAIHGA